MLPSCTVIFKNLAEVSSHNYSYVRLIKEVRGRGGGGEEEKGEEGGRRKEMNVEKKKGWEELPEQPLRGEDHMG
jgi:hypothetical protein